jgi:peptide/nickel transport system ATP-binding protein
MSLLQVEDLEITYGSGRSAAPAVRGCSLELAAGEILAVVGESGSGKSSIARAIAGIVPPSAGRILFRGSDLVARGGGAGERTRRRAIQMVFQDPDASLNPRHLVRSILEEPLIVRGIRDRAARQARVEELMQLVQLDPALLDRRPIALSGGQKQRVAIARAMALEPDILIADEALSALDVSTQATILQLFQQLRRDVGVSILFISHDLASVQRLADRVCVLFRGRIVEQGSAVDVLQHAKHPYTQLLIAATLDPRSALQDPEFLARLARGSLEDVPA